VLIAQSVYEITRSSTPAPAALDRLVRDCLAKHPAEFRNNYVAAAGGRKFLVYTLDESAGTSQPFVTVLNWTSAFKK
jgi:hypothetical protein